MIQPNELRIGNIVSLKNGYNTELPKYGKVTQVYMNGFTVDYHWPDEWFEPVELTPDILEAAGFKYNQLTENYEVFYDCVGMLGINKYDGSFVIANDNEDMGFTGDLKSSCKYLHQLQNLIYCLTGDELQIDITKLNKEK